MRVQPTLFHRFTVAEYYRLEEVGILAPDARVELLDGTIYDMLPIGPFHAGVETRLQMRFAEAAKGRWIVRVQNPVRLNDGSEPIPDLALVKPCADFYVKQHPKPPDVLLLVEVAQRSLQFDRKAKLIAYARAGVQEYWIVNLRAKCVEIHRGPLPIGEYSHETRAISGDTVAPTAFPEMKIAISELF